MKLLVLSDSHGNVAVMKEAIALEQPDRILHLGDCVPDAKALLDLGIPVSYVAGNCDWGAAEPTQQVLDLEGIRILMTHGHAYRVKMTYLPAIYAAQEQQAQVLLFGHTHHPECFSEAGLQILNPGSCGYGGSYGVLTISQGAVQCQLKSVPQGRV